MTIQDTIQENKECTMVAHVNMCDICNEHKSEHTCAICNKWICDTHSVKVDIEIDDDYIPYVCTECNSAGNGDYIATLKAISGIVHDFYDLKNTTIAQWKKEVARKNDKM